MVHYPEKRRSVENSPWLNGDAQALFEHYYSRLAGIACTRYRWTGLPPNIDPLRLEFALVLQGGLAAFSHVRANKPLKDGQLEAANGRFTVTKATYGSGKLDDLFNPAGYTTYAPNEAGGTKFDTTGPLKDWRGVPIWGDALRMDYDGQTIAMFANRLARASLVVDTNMMATTRGVVIATTQDELLTAQTTVANALSGLPTFTVKKGEGGFNLDDVKTLNLGVHPETVERSHVVAMRLLSEASTALGVQSSAQEKDERLTDDEVQAIRGTVRAVRERTLYPRQQAATLINQRYFGGATIVEVHDKW